MKKLISYILIACFVLNLALLSGCKENQNNLQKFTDYSFDYFDTVTTIVGYEESEEIFKQNCKEIKAELEIYHKLYDIYTLYEGVNNLSLLNEHENGKHKELVVDEKLIDLLEFSKQMYTETDGAVNIAFGSVLSIWHTFREEGLENPQNASIPQMNVLKQAALHTDINDIIINTEKSSVLLNDNDLTLDVGAIAKGYATEEIAKFMKDKGFTSYILNIGGNVRTLSKTPDNKNWKVGIENPDISDSENPYIEYLEISNMSLVTSGNYQRFYSVGGKNYHHIIDPDTLMPSDYFNSVSVLCENSAIADAFSTALFCMPYEKGLKLVEKNKNIEAMWVTKSGEKLYSSGFKKYCINN